MGRRKKTADGEASAEKQPGNKRKRASITVVMSMDGDEEAVREDLRESKTEQGTKENYSSKIRQFLKYLQDHPRHCSNVTEDGKITIPINKEAVLDFFGKVCKPATELAKLEGPHQLTEDYPVPYSVSQVKGYRSAIVDLYTKEKQVLDQELDTELKTLLDGYEKKICRLKLNGLMDIHEGKTHMLPQGYCTIASYFLSLTPQGHGTTWNSVIFAWAFFVLMWNLMSRSDSIDTLMLQHIEWQNDCLCIEEQGHKGDRAGSNKYSKHVYANPFQPHICPVLALAVHIFSSPGRTEGGNQQLFEGTDNKGRFARHMHTALHTGMSDAQKSQLGSAPEDIAPHSARKGSSSMCLGQVAGPSPVTVFLRMSQTLGQLKDRYIFQGDGADQLCGRMVACLPFSDLRFTVLPPHFENDILGLLTIDYWREIVPGYDNYPAGFQTTFPFLLASLVYHEKFLRDTLPRSHPIFQARVFTHNRMLEQLRGNVLLGYGCCPSTGLQATGIPPHLAVAKEVESLIEEVKKLRAEISGLKTTMMTALPRQIATHVSEEIRENFTIDGVAQLTTRDLDLRFNGFQDKILGVLQQRLTGASVAGAVQSESAATAEDETFQWGEWKWKSDSRWAHWVPEDWRWPENQKVEDTWTMWFFGNKDTRIRPMWRMLKKAEIHKSDEVKHTQAKIVMNALEAIIREERLLPDGVDRLGMLPLGKVDEVFHASFDRLIAKLYPDGKVPPRPRELGCGRLYNLITDQQQTTKKGTIKRKFRGPA